MTYKNKYYNPFISTTSWAEVEKIVSEIFPDQYLVGYVRSPSRLRRNIVMYSVNLIQNDGAVAVALKPFTIQKFHSPWHSHTYANKAIKVMCEEGFTTLTKGHNSVKFGTGFTSRLETTERFTSTFSSISYSNPSIDSFSNPLPSISYSDSSIYALGNDSLHLIERKVNRLNEEYFSKMQLSTSSEEKQEFLSNVWLTRIFGEEENSCGRFFQKYGTSYQNISKEERSKLLLNGEETVEVDFSGMHINLLYNRRNEVNPYTDSYNPILEALNLPTNLRNIIKQCVLVLINAPNYKSYVCSFNHTEEGRNMVKTLRKYNVSLKQVLEATQQVHSEIAEYFHSNASLSLMFEESEIMQSILISLHNMNVLGLPLHDAVICQKKDANTVSEVMLTEYIKATGFSIPIEVKYYVEI